MTVSRGVTTKIDNFDRAQAFTTTSYDGWQIKDTSSAGTPTYLCITEDGGAAKLTLAATSEAEIVTLYCGDVLPYDLAKLQHLWWIAKVAGIDSVTTLVFGAANAQNDTDDTVGVSAWFRMEGSASTTAVVVETDDVTNEQVDVATGETLAAVYKKFQLDFTNGLADVRFYIDGARVADGTTFDMSDVSSGQNVQPYVQLQKASGTGVPSITIAQFGVQYEWAYGA